MRVWFASVAAVVVQPLVFAAYTAPDYIAFPQPQPLQGFGIFLLYVVVVAAAIVLLLGIPAFALLRRYKRESWTSLAISGFLLGALPLAKFGWPTQLEGYSSGQNWHGKYVDLYVNGAPTIYAWLTYGESVVFYGLHGLAGALAFYAVWRKLSPNPSFKRDQL